MPQATTPEAWEHIIKRRPQCVEWTEAEVCKLVAADKVARTNEIVRRIGFAELMRFKIGLDGLQYRQAGAEWGAEEREPDRVGIGRALLLAALAGVAILAAAMGLVWMVMKAA